MAMATGRATAQVFTEKLRSIVLVADLSMQAVVEPGDNTTEGTLIEAVAVPWFTIVDFLVKDPTIAFQIPPRQWEEIVAGAYREAGFDEVTLTPRSGDYGRDIIAVKRGLGAIRVLDQVKAYKPTHLVTGNDVRALMGVLHVDPASKGSPHQNWTPIDTWRLSDAGPQATAPFLDSTIGSLTVQ
jgi:restriction system protein